jgi:hypothetical protein
VKGKQDAEFIPGSQDFSHRFYVCALPTEADWFLGSDFLVKYDVHLDLEKRELRQKQPSLSRRTHKPTDQLSFTVLVKPLNSGGSDESTQKKERVKDGRICENVLIPRVSVPHEPEPWILRSTQTIQLAPRFKHTVLGKLDLPRQCKTPSLVCVEPAQLPLEGMIAAHEVTRVF